MSTYVLQRLNILCKHFKIREFFITRVLHQLYVRVGILLTCAKHLHDHIISLYQEGRFGALKQV